jgi:hypothetical protein
MKLTKMYLKKLIKEELYTLLSEEDTIMAQSDIASGVAKGAQLVARQGVRQGLARALGPAGILVPSGTSAHSGLGVDPETIKKTYPEADKTLIQKISLYSTLSAKAGKGLQKMPPRSVVHQLASVSSLQDIVAMFKQPSDKMLSGEPGTKETSA